LITAPDHQKLTVAKGEIVEWVIFSDPEAADLLGVRIEYHHNQIMPFSGSEWLVGFFTNAPMKESILIDAPPYVLDIFAYNNSTENAHEYFIHPIIMPKKPAKVTSNYSEIFARFNRLLGRE